MRINPKDLDAIISSFRQCFPTEDHLWLFGSRVDDNKRGGDIDLYVEVMSFDSKKVYEQKSKFWILLQDRLGDQKIDIVICDPKQDLAIYKVARKEGIQLV